MAKTNKRNVNTRRTHEGAQASQINATQELRRTLMACLLWEDNFYEDGVSVADRIAQLVPQVAGETVAAMADEARNEMQLRHAPLWVARHMAIHHPAFVADTLDKIIQRPDELTEFLSLYWLDDDSQPISNQVKKGLARAFTKFDAYQLAKYDRKAGVTLKDVMFLVHPKPLTAEQAEVWQQLVEGTLAPPETWEVNLSAGEGAKTEAEKRQVWESLLAEDKLGGMALIRNLRNMGQASVDKGLIKSALGKMKASRILPFRFIASALHNPEWEEDLEAAMFRGLQSMEKLPGKTVILVDISGSMYSSVSGRSQMERIDAACGVAMIAREIADDVAVYSFDTKVHQIPSRRGFALRDAIMRSGGGGTYLHAAVDYVNAREDYDRLIVITDEQAHRAYWGQGQLSAPKGKGYMVNVATYQNGVGYGEWTHIDGWSDGVIRYIQEIEKMGGE